MRVCPVCSSQYTDGTEFCTKDGTRLTRSDAAPESASKSGVRPPGTVIGSYRLLQMIGEGGMGRVYLAEHARLGRRVALKMLRSEYASNPIAVRRFFREARAVNQINHENIVEITDFIEEEGGDNYYIMEIIKGQSLADVLTQESAVPVPRALRIAIQVSETLAAVHKAGIVHRDMKPDNIFLTEKGGQKDFVKLLDFGVAKLIDTGESKPVHQTAIGAILGTPEYMSPEQAGGRKVDFRADIYSFGIILYEMVSGRKPFRGKSYGELVIQHMTMTPARPSKLKELPQKVPKEIEELIMQCLEKEPGKRPANMGTVASRLKEIGEAESITLETFMTTPPPRTGRSRLVVAGLGLVVVLGIVLGVLLLNGSRKDAEAAKPVPDAGPASEIELVPIDNLDLSKVEITLLSSPAGARVYKPDSENPIGVTPITLSFSRTEASETFELRLEGHQSASQEISLQEDTRVMVNLAKATPVPDKSPKRKKRKKKRRKVDEPGEKSGTDPDKPLDKHGTIDPFKDG